MVLTLADALFVAVCAGLIAWCMVSESNRIQKKIDLTLSLIKELDDKIDHIRGAESDRFLSDLEKQFKDWNGAKKED